MRARTWDALDVMKSAYTAGLGPGTVPRAPCPVPRPVIMPLVLSEMAGLIWVRPVGEDALTGSRSR
ncbi:hypothetical protein AB0P40_44455, partial [Streptomyces sp. NPDC079189]